MMHFPVSKLFDALARAWALVRCSRDDWGSRSRATALAGAVGLVVAFAPGAARADDDVDHAVDAVVMVGSIAGVPISADEATVIKGIVRCAINNTPLVNCARAAVIDQLPAQARPMTSCVLKGTPIEQCGAAEILLHLPPEARDAVTCITGRNDVGKCGQQLVLNAAQKEVFKVIDNLKADGRSELDPAGSAAIRNIIELSQAIRADDWVNISVHGGAELYKAAAKIVLKAVLPEVLPAGVVLDPIVDAVVQARVDLVAKIIAGARRRDARLVGEAIVEAYLSEGFIVPCSIEQIPADVKEAVCGNLSKIIRGVADIGGDVADFAFRLIKDPLGIPDTTLKEVEKLGAKVFEGKQDDCVLAQLYYATNYAKCYHRGVRQRLAGQERLDQLISSLDHRCGTYYLRCVHSEDTVGLCKPQQTMFATQVNQLTSAVNTAANLFVRSFGQFVHDKGQAAACAPETSIFPQFLDSCARAVSLQVPLAGDPESDSCDGGPRTVLAPVAARAACQTAMLQLDTRSVLGKACEGTPQAPTGCHSNGGFCGGLSVTCNAPLPAAMEYVLVENQPIQSLSVFRSERTIGLVDAQYGGTGGNVALRVCARNKFGSNACSESFNVTLGSNLDPKCFPQPGPQLCPFHMVPCPGHGCISIHDHCDPPM